ncbi:hypothetical protein H2198_009549 [Neophaeococcomyces mojaviensis]|uniref:Uncharacterized protein n=1 Tax=Neophaeococcomyces mojaviensis TaxID=3383035 RepID=A0ACC2ZU69_9EURO|nr:hypothetical protein H2198_009549 [Knufia sp. JES_112]
MTTRTSLENFPSSLTTHIEAYLRSIIRPKQDSHHQIVLDAGYTFHAQEIISKESTNLTKLSINFLPYFHKLTNEPVYYGCPWYPEGELDLRPRYNFRQSNHFFAFLRPRWVLMVRFSPMQPYLDAQFYLMKAMRTLSLTSKAGIAKFLGVVRDDDDMITGFLIELPVKGRLRDVMEAASGAGTPISKERREKWCRQIIRTIAEVHHHGFVIGSLHHVRDCGIGIDGKDDAILYDRLGTTVEPIQMAGGAISAELGWPAKPVKSAIIEPQTDIYQLGLLLWRIMGDKVHGNILEFCKVANCTTRKDARCNEPHTNPVELPMQDDYCPKYLRDIIIACRTPEQKARPSAHELSCMLPMADNAKYTQLSTAAMYMERPEDYQIVHSSPQVDCDVCDKDANRHHFHCGICDSGDWDICSSCFTEGAHCKDIDHVLQERKTLYCPDKIFAYDKVSGERKIVMSES